MKLLDMEKIQEALYDAFNDEICSERLNEAIDLCNSIIHAWPHQSPVVNLTMELTRRSYCVEIPVDLFLALTRAEGFGGDTPYGEDLGTQIDKLLRAGRTDYNGHFGNFIFFELDVEEDTPEMHVQILGLIQAQLEKLSG